MAKKKEREENSLKLGRRGRGEALFSLSFGVFTFGCSGKGMTVDDILAGGFLGEGDSDYEDEVLFLCISFLAISLTVRSPRKWNQTTMDLWMKTIKRMMYQTAGPSHLSMILMASSQYTISFTHVMLRQSYSRPRRNTPSRTIQACRKGS
jgi:hypothetical protein